MDFFLFSSNPHSMYSRHLVHCDDIFCALIRYDDNIFFQQKEGGQRLSNLEKKCSQSNIPGKV